jgi:Holliday junction resolvase
VGEQVTGAFSRSKGARGEREIVQMLKDNLGGDYSRNLKQYQQSQEGDISQLVGPYLLEVKNCASITNIKAWWQQSKMAAAKVGAIPCLAYKIPRKGWRFMVPIPVAWAGGQQWGTEIQFTQTLYPDGFFLLVRELGG